MGNLAPMITLRHWLDSTGTRPEAFADQVKVHWVTVYKWMNGTARPSFGKLREIERATAGAITACNLVTPRSAHQDKHEVSIAEATP